MNYSRNIKKQTLGKRIVISWVIVGVFFFLVGIGVCKIASLFAKPEVPPEEPKTETIIFGQYDGIIFEGEMPGEYQSGVQFVPLNVPMNTDQQDFVFYLSQAYDIDFTFVMALIQKESSFQADVVSKTGDWGLMQINEINHPYISETLGFTDFTDPYNNVRGGMFILRKLFEKYQQPEKVLMAYNMGETGASRLWEQGVFETNYSKSILQIQQRFNAELEGSSNND